MWDFTYLEQIRQIQKAYEACSRSTLLSPQTISEVLRQARETFSMTSAFGDTHFRGGLLPPLEAQTRMLAEAAKAAIVEQERIARAISHAVELSHVAWEHAFFRRQVDVTALLPSGFFESLKAVELHVSRIAEIQQFTDTVGNTVVRACLKNAEVFQNLQAARLSQFLLGSRFSPQVADLPVAAQFVVDYTRFVPRGGRQQGSTQPEAEPDVDPIWRGEEIGARLEAQLLRIDKRFVELRRRGWEAMAKSGPAALLLAAHALRELFRQVLHTLAPDEQVKSSPVWLARKDATEARLTRRMRLEFLLASEPEKLATLLQFLRSLDKANEFAHTFPENRELVRVELSELEKLTYLLLVFAKEDDGD